MESKHNHSSETRLGERSELPGGTGVVPPGGYARQLDALAGFASAELDPYPSQAAERRQ
jgi:hypothetical protein